MRMTIQNFLPTADDAVCMRFAGGKREHPTPIIDDLQGKAVPSGGGRAKNLKPNHVHLLGYSSVGGLNLTNMIIIP